MTKDITPGIDAGAVSRIFERCIGHTPEAVSRIGTGQISATFECVGRGELFVVQFSEPAMGTGVDFERRFRERLTQVSVPLRELICEGLDDGLRWTVTRKAVGETMTALSGDDYEQSLVSVFDTLLAMASVDVSDTGGFGWLDESGWGKFDSWAGHILFVREEEPDEMFYGKWHHLFETTFLEHSRYERYSETMALLLEGLETPRALVHGGFGHNNILIHEARVSAVLDWQDARFGDPLFDVAYLDFWPSGIDLVDRFEAHCDERGVSQVNYRRRVRCYKYNIGLDSMRFFAKTDNRSAYDAAVQIIEGLEE